jgi:hypothetical protein
LDLANNRLPALCTSLRTLPRAAANKTSLLSQVAWFSPRLRSHSIRPVRRINSIRAARLYCGVSIQELHGANSDSEPATPWMIASIFEIPIEILVPLRR